MSEHAMVPHDFIKPTIRSMMPGDIVYPQHTEEVDALFYNKDSYELFVYGAMELESEDLDPTSLLGRIGIMRVYNFAPKSDPSEPDVLIDGYIANLHFTKSPIEYAHYGDEMPGDVEEEAEWFEDHKDRLKLLAVESRGPNGRPIFNGNELARSAMKYLSTEMQMLYQHQKQQNTGHKTTEDAPKTTQRRHTRSAR